MFNRRFIFRMYKQLQMLKQFSVNNPLKWALDPTGIFLWNRYTNAQQVNETSSVSQTNKEKLTT